MIIEEYKAVFIHIPKTAGTSVKRYFKLNSKLGKHGCIWQYNNYKKFTIVRNPYDRIVSWYFFIKKLNNLTNTTFREYAKTNVLKSAEILKPQHEWIDDTVKTLSFENLEKELSDFFNKKIKLKTINKSKHKHYLDYYNQETLDIVYERYKEDFEKFNYKRIKII